MVTINSANNKTGAAGTLLQGQGVGTASDFSTSTYPSTNAISTLLYASSANVMAALATANNGVFITSSGGVPSISSTLPSAVQTNITATGTLGNQLNTTRACFISNLSSAPSNVTGDGTNYTIICDQEIDQGGDYNTSTGVFTAPVTGKYIFCYNIVLGGLTALFTKAQTFMVTTAKTYLGESVFAGVDRDSTNNLSLSGTVIANMTASDTAYLTVTVSGSTKTVGIYGNNSSISYTYLSGYLLC